MQQTLGGAEKYKEAFLEKLKEVREIGKDLTLTLPEAEMGCEAEAGCDASTAVFTNSGRNRVYTRLSVRSQVQNFVSVRMSPSM